MTDDTLLPNGYLSITGKCSIADATCLLAQRYLYMMPEDTEDPFSDHPRLSLVNLRWICREILADDGSLPVDKISRWLGFVQGCLAMRGITDVDVERDVSRPLIHAAYKLDGIDIPKTRER
jgi:hypothetical protein